MLIFLHDTTISGRGRLVSSWGTVDAVSLQHTWVGGISWNKLIHLGFIKSNWGECIYSPPQILPPPSIQPGGRQKEPFLCEVLCQFVFQLANNIWSNGANRLLTIWVLLWIQGGFFSGWTNYVHSVSRDFFTCFPEGYYTGINIHRIFEWTNLTRLLFSVICLTIGYFWGRM